MAAKTQVVKEEKNDLGNTPAAQADMDAVAAQADKAMEEQPKTPAEKLLPELIGGFVQSCMEDPRKLQQCYRELALWYESQPTEGRRELIPQIRKKIEAARLTTEALYGQFQMISQRDL